MKIKGETMKKIIIAATLALSCVTAATAGEVGLYLGDTTFLTASTHKLGHSRITGNILWGTKDTGDTYFGNQVAFQTFGIGAGYVYDDLMDRLSLEASAGYGSSDVKVASTNLKSTDSSSGLYYSLGASYQVLPTLPLLVGVKLISVPKFNWTATTGKKSYGGASIVAGASLAF